MVLYNINVLLALKDFIPLIISTTTPIIPFTPITPIIPIIPTSHFTLIPTLHPLLTPVKSIFLMGFLFVVVVGFSNV
jgi:hypothetical protein